MFLHKNMEQVIGKLLLNGIKVKTTFFYIFIPFYGPLPFALKYFNHIKSTPVVTCTILIKSRG